jgi:hypothetical protein
MSKIIKSEKNKIRIGIIYLFFAKISHIKVQSRKTNQVLDLLRVSLEVTFSKNKKKFATKVLCGFFLLLFKILKY